MNFSKKLYCKLGDPTAVLSSVDKRNLTSLETKWSQTNEAEKRCITYWLRQLLQTIKNRFLFFWYRHVGSDNAKFGINHIVNSLALEDTHYVLSIIPAGTICAL